MAVSQSVSLPHRSCNRYRIQLFVVLNYYYYYYYYWGVGEGEMRHAP